MVPPILIGGQVPVRSLRFSRQGKVAATLLMYPGKAKNSRLELVNVCLCFVRWEKSYETPTGAAESWPLAFDGGVTGTLKVKLEACPTSHMEIRRRVIDAG